MKKFEDLTFSDDYIFKLVMEEADVFKAVLENDTPRVLCSRLCLIRKTRKHSRSECVKALHIGLLFAWCAI